MRHCKTCDISYETPLERCLLCNNLLEDTNDQKLEFSFPAFKEKSKFMKYFVRGFLFLNLISIILSLTIEYLISKDFTWSLIVSVTNLYLILFIKIILANFRVAIRVFWLVIISIVEIIIIAIVTGDPRWALDIVLPHSLMFNTLILTIFTLSKRKRWQDYTMFLLISIITNMAIILLPLLGQTTTSWAFTTSFFYGLFTLLGFLIFTPRHIREEFLRRFHI